jgi:hypothetical protein
MLRSRASRPDSCRWSFSGSASWWPIVSTGLSEVIGSWKIIAIWLPRTSISSAGDSASRSIGRSAPRKSASPPTIRPGSAIRRISESAVTLLPQPDSPTIPSTSPWSSENDTPSTARTVSSSIRKWVLRSVTSNNLPIALPPAGRAAATNAG